MKKWLSMILALLMALTLFGCSQEEAELAGAIVEAVVEEVLTEEESTAVEESAPEEAQPEAPEEAPAEAPAEEETADEDEAAPLLDEHGSYTTKEDVALYIYTYGHLPDNFITKKEAEALGWPGGSLEPYAPGMCIGGNRFGNYEGLLPEAEGRKYTECDIDTLGASKRGAKRIVFSNDGLIYYTDDHYESFELLYGEE